jgi:aspartyl protease family protein
VSETIDDQGSDGARQGAVQSPPDELQYHRGKTLRFALIAVGALFVSGTVTAMLTSYVSTGLVDVIGTPVKAAAAVAPGAARPSRAPAAANTPLTYRADASGHFYVTAQVNGAPIRFLVDTGATVVALTPDDARAAGIFMASLQYTENMSTANGQARAAQTSLRDIRLDQLFVGDVAAVVMEQPMPVSLLGMSFLRRLNGYSIKDGVLTIDW